MPEYLGSIPIPELVTSGTFPIDVDYGMVRVSAPQVVTHSFGHGDAQIEQRFFLGTGTRTFQLSIGLMDADRVDDLVEFYNNHRGSYDGFTLNIREQDGSTSSYTARFAQPHLTLDQIRDCIWSGSVELVEVPSDPPSYTASSTLTRFPSEALKTALLDQVQQVFPLVRVAPVSGSAFYISDRKVSVDGQLYQPRILDWSGISQSLGGAADSASFSLGNADRVLTQLVNEVDLDKADIQFALYHVGSNTKINLWRGYVTGWSFDSGPVFQLHASDGLYQLRLPYPSRKITRQDGFTVGAQPVSVGGKKGIEKINATSVTNDTAYGKPLRDLYVSDEAHPYPVKCDVIAGRDESEFFAALGVISRGPISGFGAGHTLDGSLNHGPGNMGLRRSFGGSYATGDPAPIDNSPDYGSNLFELDNTSGEYPPGTTCPDGVAFIQVRRTDEKGIQPSNASMQHELIARITGGLGGFVWTAPGARSWTPALTNPVWIAVNVLIYAKGKYGESAVEQEELFDVDSAISAAGICDTIVTPIIGTGTETQFRFTGVIEEEKPLRDWINEILGSCLGYSTFHFGKLKVGIRCNSSAVESFTVANILHNSLTLTSHRHEYNDLTVSFADRDYGYQQNAVNIKDSDSISRIGETLKANINLVGVSTKSQASRIAMTKIREVLGGLTAAEQLAARNIGFKTTVLALNTEPGMVCSLTHDDMPNGTGEFRVTGWTLNRDYSIDIQGVTTTDSMYDYTIGPKPVDVPPAELYDEPGDVVAIGGEPFTLTDVVDGPLQWSATLTYAPPDPIGSFSGVDVYLGEDIDGTARYRLIKSAPYVVETPGDQCSVSLRVDSPLDETKTYDLVVCSTSGTRRAQPNDSRPQREITITMADFGAATGLTGAPDDVASCTVSYDEVDDSYWLTSTIEEYPAKTVQIEVVAKIYRDTWCTDLEHTGSIGYLEKDELSKKFGPFPKIDEQRYVKLELEPRNADGSKAAHKTTSSNYVTVTAAGAAGTVPEATQPGANDWSIGTLLSRTSDQAGVQWCGVPITVTIPADAAYVQVWSYRGDNPPASPSLYRPVMSILQGTGPQSETWWIEKEQSAYTLQLVVTASNSQRTTFPGAATPVKTVTVPQYSLAGAISNSSVEAVPYTINGQQHYRLRFNGTYDTSDENLQWFIARWRFTDSSFNNPGPWEIIWYGAPGKEVTGSPFSVFQPDQPWQAWDTTKYVQAELGTVNFSGEENWSGVLSNLTLATDNKVDSTALKNIGAGLKIDGGALKSTLTQEFTNRDYEFDATDWEFYGNAAVVTGVGINGSKAVKMVGDGGNNYITRYFNARQGEKYSCSVWAKSNTNGYSYVQLSFLDASFAWLDSYTNAGVNTTDWAKYDLISPVAPANTAYLRVVAHVQTSSTTGEMYVDSWSPLQLQVPGGNVTVGKGLDNSSGVISSLSRELQNGNFDDGLAGWTNYYPNNITVENTGGVSGSKWIKHVPNGVFVGMSQALPIVPGQAKRVNAQLINTTASPFYLVVAVLDSNGTAYSWHTDSVPAGTSTWTPVSVYVPPVSSAAAFLNIYTKSNAASGGYAGIDCVTVEDLSPIGSGLTRSADGNIVADLGGGLTISENRIVPSLGGGVQLDGSLKISLNLTSDFVVDGTGKLSQSAVDLAKAYNFGSEFTVAGNAFVVNAIAVNKLLAGTALFSGQCVFANSNNNSKVTIESTGTAIYADSANYVSTSTSGLTVRGGSVNVTDGTKQVLINSAGVDVKYDANNKVEIRSTGITITGGSGRTLTMSSSGVIIQNDANNKVEVTSTKIKLVGSSSTLEVTTDIYGANLSASNGSVFVNDSLTVKYGLYVENNSPYKLDCQAPAQFQSGADFTGSVNFATGANVDFTDATSVTGLTYSMVGAAAESHTHTGYAASSHTHAWSDITGEPTYYAPTSHRHSINTADVEVMGPDGVNTVWIKVVSSSDPYTGYTGG